MPYVMKLGDGSSGGPGPGKRGPDPAKKEAARSWADELRQRGALVALLVALIIVGSGIAGYFAIPRAPAEGSDSNTGGGSEAAVADIQEEPPAKAYKSRGETGEVMSEEPRRR